MVEFVKFPHSPIAEEGWWIVGASLAVSLVFLFGYAFLFSAHGPWTGVRILFFIAGVLSALFFLFSCWFFRNPTRVPDSSGQKAVVSAADGRVLKVERVYDVRYGSMAEKLSIFMSPLDVHVNRAPFSGTVEKVEYVPGKFFAANLDKASTDNEHSFVLLRSAQGDRIGFLQIAGFLARRIVCHVKPGDVLTVGQRYGMIRFGSRMEIFMPDRTKILVNEGDQVYSGKTVVGQLP